MKHQITSTKLQTNSKFQNTNSKLRCFGYWNFGHWKLFGIWDLGFGVSRRGIGLVEIVIVAAFLGLMLVGVSQIVIFGNRLLIQAANRYEATLYAREAVEGLKSLRNESWSQNIVTLTNGTTYYMTTTGTIARQWQLTVTNPGFLYGRPQNFSRSIVLAAVQRDGSGNIVGSGTPDANTRQVTITMTWTEGATSRTLTMATYMANVHGN